jgi:hypothetical protein
MDDLMFLRQLRSDVPPPTSAAISAARDQLYQAADAARRSPLDEQTGGSPSWRPRLSWPPHSSGRPRRLLRLAMVGGLALAVAAGTTLALRPGGHRAGPPAARLAAWTVTGQPSGVLKIRLRQLSDPQGLRDLLRTDGVPTRIQFLHHSFEPTTSQDVIPRSCRTLPMSDEANAKLQGKILVSPFGHPNKDGVSKTKPWVLGIRASAIPAGVGIFWRVWANKSVPGAYDMDVDLVQVSASCTGG